MNEGSPTINTTVNKKLESVTDSSEFRAALTHIRIEAERRGGQYLADFNVILAGLQSLKTENKALRGIATVDRLTLLTSRDGVYKAIRDMVGKDMERIKNGEGVHYLCMAIDLDKFKPINDALGHAGGDFALQKFAEILRTQLRDTALAAQVETDSKEGSVDMLKGRPGGDEFLAVIPVYTDQKDKEKIEEKLNEVKFRIQSRIDRELLRLKIKRGGDDFIAIVDDGLADIDKGEYSLGATIIYESCELDRNRDVETEGKKVEETLKIADEKINEIKARKKSR